MGPTNLRLFILPLLTNFPTSQNTKMATGNLVFVTGLSGSGKTTLGERLKKDAGFAHFNCDIWAFGGDPIEESASVPTPAMMEKRDPAVKAAFDAMVANGFVKLASGETPDPQAWETFYNLLCPAITEARAKLGDKPMVVTFSVYLRSARDSLREKLPGVAFVVLNPNIDDVGFRKADHLRNTAQARGMTLSQFLKSLTPGAENAPDMEESAIVGLLTAQAKAGAVGFEPAQKDEPRTLGLGTVTVDEAYEEVMKFVKTL